MGLPSEDEIRALLESDPARLRGILVGAHAEDVAEVLGELSDEQALALMRQLPVETAAEVLHRLPDELQSGILGGLHTDHAADLMVEMAPDDRADVVQELPSPLRDEILSHLDLNEPEVARDLRTLSAHEPETAGGLMTTEYVALSSELRARDALDELRRLGREQDVEMLYYVYAIAQDGRLTGVLSLRELILADPGQRISEAMTRKLVTVAPETDQEDVANTMARYDYTALPVVDARGCMLGVVTVDDVVDVVIEEATEDAQKMGAVEPISDRYLDTGILKFVRKRITWLALLFVGELLTASVMETYEGDLAVLLDLAIFIPLIISSGGNSGSQSSSLIIRALALDEIGPADWLRILWRELSIGLMLGALLAAVGFIRAYFLMASANALTMGVTVASSILAVVSIGSLTGSLLPLAIKRLGGDPAVSSTPFVASLVDVIGLVVYFSAARLFFSIVL
ncbi:MAG: magnesium transporter [Proteobacteria bacterium]|nr:magnesium transporter [Pseudomonadota bacterium]